MRIVASILIGYSIGRILVAAFEQDIKVLGIWCAVGMIGLWIRVMIADFTKEN